MTKHVELRFEDNIAFLQLTYGKHEFTHEFLDEFNEALDDVLRNPDAQVLVTYGTGRHFSNGIDLASVFSKDNQNGYQFTQKLSEFLARILTFPMPTVAAVNGHAIAGGMLLVLAHDFKVMNSERGWLSMPEINMPQMFPVTLMEILRAKIPVGTARRDIINMGKRLTGPDALQYKIIDEVTPPSEVLSRAMSMAKEVVKGGGYDRGAMSDMKRDLYKNVVDSINIYNHLPPYYLKSSM